MDLTDFETERPRLTAIATRILGSHTDADDVVQEARLRFSRAQDVDDPPAWMTTVVTRLCLDHLRKRRTRSEAEADVPVDPAQVDPEADALLAERVGGAMQVVLDAVAPAERVAFVLHDVFGFRFDEISAVLGRSDSAVRQLASRARRKVQGLPEQAAESTARDESRQVVEAFLAAARGGELARLLALLAPDVVMRADLVGQQMGTSPVYDGAAAVAERFNGARGGSTGRDRRRARCGVDRGRHDQGRLRVPRCVRPGTRDRADRRPGRARDLGRNEMVMRGDYPSKAKGSEAL
jgi:RNA polymerase sigma factor (sigma-70 family)